MIKIKSNDFSNVLSLVKPVCSGKIIPILDCVKLDINSENNRLNIVASNSEMQISTSCDVILPYHDSNSGCIDADKLDKFVRTCGNDVELEIVIGSDKKASLRGKSRSTVNVLSVDDFPEMKLNLNKSISIKLNASDLAIAINSVDHCVATNDYRVFLTGLSFSLRNGYLTLMGSDSFRLSTITLPVNCNESIECVIPLKTAQTIAKTFKHGDISLSINRGCLSVTDGETTIIGKNIDAKFPDFSKILNVVRTNHAIVKRSDFVSGIESVLLTATDQTKKIAITFSHNNINFVCSNSQGEQSETDVQCEYDGEEFMFAANADFVLQSAKKIDNTININWLDRTSFIMTGDDECGPVHLIMPINV